MLQVNNDSTPMCSIDGLKKWSRGDTRTRGYPCTTWISQGYRGRPTPRTLLTTKPIRCNGTPMAGRMKAVGGGHRADFWGCLVGANMKPLKPSKWKDHAPEFHVRWRVSYRLLIPSIDIHFPVHGGKTTWLYQSTVYSPAHGERGTVYSFAGEEDRQGGSGPGASGAASETASGGS